MLPLKHCLSLFLDKLSNETITVEWLQSYIQRCHAMPCVACVCVQCTEHCSIKMNSIPNLYHFYFLPRQTDTYVFAHWSTVKDREPVVGDKVWENVGKATFVCYLENRHCVCVPLAKQWYQIFGFHKLNSFEEFSFDLRTVDGDGGDGCDGGDDDGVWDWFLSGLLSNPMNMYAFDWNIWLFERWVKSLLKGRDSQMLSTVLTSSIVGQSPNLIIIIITKYRTLRVMPSH